jgi:hypothetical protein
MDKETLKFIIQRYDGLYNAVNSKANYFLAINTFIGGAILASYKPLLDLIPKTSISSIAFYNCIVIAELIIVVISIFTTCLAINPFLKSGNSLKKNKYKSLIYFGSVADFKKKDYKHKIKEMKDEELLNDMVKQAWILATGLKMKFKYLKFSSWLVFFEILFILILINIII